MFDKRSLQTSPLGELDYFYNNSGAIIPAGGAVVLDCSIATPYPGACVVKPSAGLLGLFVGAADEDIAIGAWGNVLTRGYRTVTVLDAANNIVIGDTLVPVAGQWYFAKGAAGDGLRGMVHAAAAVTIAVSTVAAAFIRGK